MPSGPEVTGNAKFVEFWNLADAEQMPFVRIPFLDWPYVEAIRLDEAMHPLTILAFWHVRRSHAQTERRPGAPGGTLEIRV